ncbi:MAG: hypothetical protein K9N21_12610 [Deltaproteobacteria bacterium]|nr:hypothetical protein [Deltaproteobacteria bacterium]
MRGGMDRRFKRLTMLCLLFCVQGAWAGGSDLPEPRLKTRFIPDSARVGSMVELALTYRLPEGAKLPPEPLIKGLEGLDVVGIQKNNGEIRIRLLVDRLGEFKTGPLSLAFLTPEGSTEFLHTDPVGLTVLSNLGERPDEARIKPIYGIIPTGSGFMESLGWGLAALGACAAGLGIFLWLRRRRKKRGLPRVQVPPHHLAEKEIHALASQEIFEKGHVKEFYFRFSEILRRYLESLRGFPAAEYTTQEIALSIQAPEDRKILPLLQDADLVKFADLIPTPARKRDEIEQALAYIRETGSAFEKDPADHSVKGRGIGIGGRRAIQNEGAAP